MQPTEILMQEHRVIEQVLDCLEIIAQSSETNKKLDLEAANQAIDFFQNFADRCHHGKEEDCLFPMLEQKGFSPEQGPTGVMRHEHELGRQHTRGMKDASQAASTGNLSAIENFAFHARTFVKLLREHIEKEDQCLFQMANHALSEQEQHELMESFAKVEYDDMGPETHGKYLDIATHLASKFGIESVASQSSTCGNCCGHG